MEARSLFAAYTRGIRYLSFDTAVMATNSVVEKTKAKSSELMQLREILGEVLRQGQIKAEPGRGLGGSRCTFKLISPDGYVIIAGEQSVDLAYLQISRGAFLLSTCVRVDTYPMTIEWFMASSGDTRKTLVADRIPTSLLARAIPDIKTICDAVTQPSHQLVSEVTTTKERVVSGMLKYLNDPRILIARRQ